MSPTPYERFFSSLTGFAPFPYQKRLATDPWPELLDIPTGLGKTAAVIVAWLHKRLSGGPGTGRRLIYCLPTRVLVDQTRAAAQTWVDAATPSFAETGRKAPTVHILRGGDLDESWEGFPETDAILIGTQDMLLSRALNRGFAMPRSRWPMHFGLLNNDAFWVFDEIQLMGVGVETSAQLQGFREKFGVEGESRSLWMSATLGQGQLDTVDHPRPVDGFIRQELGAEDRALSPVQARTEAKKRVLFSSLRLESSKAASEKTHLSALADEIFEAHTQRAGLTLVILNSVQRARNLRRILEGRVQAIALIHSRFRPLDRQAQEAFLQADGSRVIIATQAIEAGVDVSSRTLFTELCPWPSLVQRIGRCNRRGQESNAEVRLIDLAVEDDDSLALPYAADEMLRARELLKELGADASPSHLGAIDYRSPEPIRPVVRRRDLLQLFDTTPDLLGNDIDVSRFIRDDSDTDVQLYWRDFEARPEGEEPQPHRDELCAISIGNARDLLKKLKAQGKKASGKKPPTKKPKKSAKNSATLFAPTYRAYSWEALRGEWKEVDHPYPGQAILLHAGVGAYEASLGYTGDLSGLPVPPVEPDKSSSAFDQQLGADRRSQIDRWVELGVHLGHVEGEASVLGHALNLSESAALATRRHRARVARFIAR